MNIQTKPYHLIQIFNNSYTYDKAYKNFDSRQAFVQWKDKVPSPTSIQKDQLLISPTCYQNKIGIVDNLVILYDHNFFSDEDLHNLDCLNNPNKKEAFRSIPNGLSQKNTVSKIQFGALSKRPFQFEIFDLKMKDQLELFLHWDYWKIGEPQRTNFKIANLELGKPIHMMIDGKRDFSMSSRKKRVFLENNYILTYQGIFREIHILKEEKIYWKTIPKNIKEINLMKYVK